MSEPDPYAVFARGNRAALIFEKGDEHSVSGLIAKAYGRGKPRAGGKRGPIRGASRVPTLSEESGKRKCGRPVRAHAFLDLIRYRLKKFRRRQKVDYYSDLLRDFRKDLWFLILAGYPVNSIRWIFSSELPKLFSRLSFDGTLTSLKITLEQAEVSRIDLDEEYLDLLEYYSAGPWAHNAPDWLRAQYGVPLAEPKTGGKNSVSGKKEAEISVLPVEAVVGGSGKSLEDFQKESLFVDSWIKYRASHPGMPDLSPEEMVLGVTQGLSAVLASRALAGGVGNLGGGVPGDVPPVSPVLVRVEGESSRTIKFLEEVAMVEASMGAPLNLVPTEMVEALEVGLLAVLAKRLGSGSSGPANAGSGIGVTAPVPLVELTDSGRAALPSGGVDSGVVGGGKPVDSVGVVSAVASESGDLVAPEEPVKDLGVEVVSPEVPAVVSPKGSISEIPVSKKVTSPEVVAPVVPVSDPVVRVEQVVEAEPEWLKFPGFGIAAGVLAGPGVDPFNVGKVPRVWKLDEEAELAGGYQQPSEFYKSLGKAAPYLVDYVTSTDYGSWVLRDDNGFGIYENFGDGSPKKEIDLERTRFPTIFPKLKSCPTTKEGMLSLTFEQARDCYDEWCVLWNEDNPDILPRIGSTSSMEVSDPHPMLLDLVNRGMGPAYWGLGDHFLMTWILGLAVRKAFGFSVFWCDSEGVRRMLPMARAMTPELAREVYKAGYRDLCPWRATAPMFIETLAPRRESENLPGHIWVSGQGYLRIEDREAFLAKVHAYVKNSNHPDFLAQKLSVPEVYLMVAWAKDVNARISSRHWVSANLEQGFEGGFYDRWLPRYSEPCYACASDMRHVASPLFCYSDSVASRYDLLTVEWLTPQTLNAPSTWLCPPWEAYTPFKGVSAKLPQIPFQMHVRSMYAVNYYFRHLEQRVPVVLEKGLPLKYRGSHLPEKFKIPLEKIPFPPSDYLRRCRESVAHVERARKAKEEEKLKAALISQKSAAKEVPEAEVP